MHKIIAVCACIFLLLSGCSTKPRENSKMNSETVKIVIDENVINTNNVFSIIEPLWWSVSIYDGEQRYLEDLKRFTEPQRYVFAIEWYLAEVDNGGHDQFYFNSTGIVWEDALNGFIAIGLENNYLILKESAERLGGKPSKDRSVRQGQMEKHEPQFNDLDERLYESEGDIGECLIKYIKENMNSFLFEGYVEKPKN